MGLRQPPFRDAERLFLSHQAGFLLGEAAGFLLGPATVQRGFRRAGETDIGLIDAPKQRRGRILELRDNIIAQETRRDGTGRRKVAEKFFRTLRRPRLAAEDLGRGNERGDERLRRIGLRRGSLKIDRDCARLAHIGRIRRLARALRPIPRDSSERNSNEPICRRSMPSWPNAARWAMGAARPARRLAPKKRVSQWSRVINMDAEPLLEIVA